MKSPALFRTFKHAWRGIRLGFRSERNFRIEVAVALLLLVLIILIPLQVWERVVLVIVAMMVLVLELLNSALERMVDLAKPRMDFYAGDVKDLLAAAVLLAALVALAVGVIILVPHFSSFFVRV